MRSEFKLLNLYEVIVGWFCNDQRQFRVSSSIIPGSYVELRKPVGSSLLALSRWVPNNREGIERIAQIVTCGAYTVLPSSSKVENVGSGDLSEFDVLSGIHEIYGHACWDYNGPELPKPSRLVDWKGHLAWFEKCRDIIGATSMLEAYVSGVPLEDIVLTSMIDEQELWYKRKWLAGDCDAISIKPPRFPNIRSKNSS